MPFAITIFISAFLLFQVQPVIARYILPWYGGGIGVWTACILFFQVGLLLGYSYAFLLKKHLTIRKQVILHLSILFITLLLLPITPSEALKPTGSGDPLNGIIYLLLATVGVPYMMISSTGPLLQHWYQKHYRDRSPYRLYALSNVGSLLGLLSYPFLVEPMFSLQVQTLIWSFGYVAFVIVCSWCGYFLVRYQSASIPIDSPDESPVKGTGIVDPLLWLAYAACGSILLLATTNKVTQDIAVIPFLWVIPLALYLVTFIIAFDSPRWYNRYFWLPAFFVSLLLVSYILAHDLSVISLTATTLVMSCVGTMFVACMICHGEMTRIKPDPAHLTLFYLMVALGGAIGGIFVSLFSPMLFNGFWEYHLVWVLVIVLSGFAVFRNPGRTISSVVRWSIIGGWGAAAIILSVFMLNNITHHYENSLTERRNFYGVLSVNSLQAGTYSESRELYHGVISHGIQLMYPKFRSKPLSYYGHNSGAMFALQEHPLRRVSNATNKDGFNVGVIGLGIGTLATYASPNDNFKMYEINPDVEILAREYFTYLKDARAPVDVILGDGRMSLATELKEYGSQRFDVLVVDAFNGDVIPVHLLTREAFELYWQHLNTDGILAVHITNIYINLRPVVKAMAAHFNKDVYYVSTIDNFAKGIAGSDWMLLTSNPEFMNKKLRKQFSRLPEGDPENILWSDDYSSIFPLLIE